MKRLTRRAWLLLLLPVLALLAVACGGGRSAPAQPPLAEGPASLPAPSSSNADDSGSGAPPITVYHAPT